MMNIFGRYYYYYYHVAIVVQLPSRARLFVTLWIAACQASLSITNYPNSCPLSQWCHPAISSSDALFSFCLQSFPALGTFLVSHLFTSGDQNTGASASLSPRVCSNSCPLSGWCCLIILSSAAPFSFCLQSFPVSQSFSVSWLFASGGQNIGALASVSVLPVNIQSWSPLRLTALISLMSKGLSGVFSSITIRRHQFFGVLPSLQSRSHNHTWPLGRP